MARYIERFEWHHTPLGPISGWPEHLRVAVSMVLENAFPQMLFCGPELIVCAYNDSYAPLLGRGPALGCSHLDDWVEAGSPIEPALRQAWEGRTSRIVDAEFGLLRNGEPETAYFDFAFSPVRDPSGNVFAVVKTAVEKTAEVRLAQEAAERAKAEEELRQSEARFRAVADLVPDLLWRSDSNGNTPWLNQRWLDYTGQTLEEAAGWGWAEAIHPDDRQRSAANYLRAAETGEPLMQEHRIRRHDGAYRWFIVRAEPVRDAAGKLQHLFGSATDIHDQRTAAEALRESEARLRIAIKNAAIIPAQMDRDLRYRWIYNPHPDFDADAVLGKRDDELEDSAGTRELMALKRRVIESGREERANIRFDRSDGVRVYDVYVEPLQDAHGAVVGLTSSSLDVTDRLLAEQALASMNAALVEADRRKDEFLATLAHELRNPLAPIQSAIDTLRLKGDAATIAQVLPMMQRQAAQLKRLIDDLLDITRITKGKFTLAKESVDLRQIVRNVVEASLPSAQRRIQLDLPEGPLRLLGDEVRLRQAIGNVVDNACKYTGENGNVWISADRDGEEAEIRIADDGRGIAPEFLERIFDQFQQADSSEGLGLGLTLVRKLVEMHGGSIEARSAGIGHGSEFIMRLPLSASGADAVQGQGRHDAGGAKRRVLVVDDNRDAAFALQLLLESEGHLVEIAHDGPGALRALETSDPEVLLLDIGLPGMDGIEVAKQARAMPTAEKLIIIAVTGWGQVQNKARTRDAGFDHHLIKPVDVEKLRGLLRA